MQLGGSCALNGELPLWSVIIVWLACTVPVARGAAGLIDDLTRAVGRSSNGITGLSHEQTMGAED